MSWYPFITDAHREAIEAHKQKRLANYHVRYVYEKISQSGCITAWIEQQGDAELYKERWMELEVEKDGAE